MPALVETILDDGFRWRSTAWCHKAEGGRSGRWRGPAISPTKPQCRGNSRVCWFSTVPRLVLAESAPEFV